MLHAVLGNFLFSFIIVLLKFNHSISHLPLVYDIPLHNSINLFIYLYYPWASDSGFPAMLTPCRLPIFVDLYLSGPGPTYKDLTVSSSVLTFGHLGLDSWMLWGRFIMLVCCFQKGQGLWAMLPSHGIGLPIPPSCWIVVCPDNILAKLVWDWISSLED